MEGLQCLHTQSLQRRLDGQDRPQGRLPNSGSAGVMSRKFLQFLWKGVIYQYKATPFGLNIAPYVFETAAYVRIHGIANPVLYDMFLAWQVTTSKGAFQHDDLPDSKPWVELGEITGIPPTNLGVPRDRSKLRRNEPTNTPIHHIQNQNPVPKTGTQGNLFSQRAVSAHRSAYIHESCDTSCSPVLPSSPVRSNIGNTTTRWLQPEDHAFPGLPSEPQLVDGTHPKMELQPHRETGDRSGHPDRRFVDRLGSLLLWEERHGLQRRRLTTSTF